MRSSVAAAACGGWVVVCLLTGDARSDDVTDAIAARQAGDNADAPERAAARPSPLALHAYERDLAWFGSVGARYGTSVIDGVSGGDVTELVLAGGLHLDRVTVFGEYAGSLVHHDATTQGALATTAGAPTVPVAEQTTDGVMSRLGLYGRYAFARAMSTPDGELDGQTIGELYLQAGGGAEVIQWDLGGRLVRPELSVALGMLGAYRGSPHSRHGIYADVRFQVARRIDEDNAAATCAAPCTEATPPVAWSDRSVMLETGLVFGR